MSNDTFTVSRAEWWRKMRSGEMPIFEVEPLHSGRSTEMNRGPNWRPSFACNLFASIDWAYVFSWGPMYVGRR